MLKKSTFQHQSEYKTWSLALFWRNFSRESHHRVHFYWLLLNCWTIPLKSGTPRPRKINMEPKTWMVGRGFSSLIGCLWGSICSFSGVYANFTFLQKKPPRWAPTSYEWGYDPYKWPYKWVYNRGFYTPVSGVGDFRPTNPILNTHWAPASSADSTSVPWLMLNSHGRFPSLDQYPTKTPQGIVGTRSFIVFLFQGLVIVDTPIVCKKSPKIPEQTTSHIFLVFFQWMKEGSTECPEIWS